VKTRFTSQAEAELATAIDYYESKQPGLGASLLTEVEAAQFRIEKHPMAWTPMSPRMRKCGIHRFPFALLYEVRSDEAVILAVMDLRRDPVRWEEYLE
jgi:hypothetical protein